MRNADAKVTVGIPTFNRAAYLRESIASVLSQSYTDLQLLVCDNASTDDTPEVVASFDDPRVVYVRADENIGMLPNFNRLIELADTEFAVLLPDDDLLYTDYLQCTVAVLERHARVGMVHTAFDLIDETSRVLEHGKMLVAVEGDIRIESSDEYLTRSMLSPWTVCWPSALFRTQVLVDADGKRVEEEPMADVPLLMRVATQWEFACISRTLAATRIHSASASTSVIDAQPRILYDHRRRFLDEAALPEGKDRRYRALADETFRRDTIQALATRAGAGAPWTQTSRALARIVRADPRTLLLPVTWRLGAAQLGGRYARQAAHRLRRDS